MGIPFTGASSAYSPFSANHADPSSSRSVTAPRVWLYGRPSGLPAAAAGAGLGPKERPNGAPRAAAVPTARPEERSTVRSGFGMARGGTASRQPPRAHVPQAVRSPFTIGAGEYTDVAILASHRARIRFWAKSVEFDVSDRAAVAAEGYDPDDPAVVAPRPGCWTRRATPHEP